MSGKNRLFKSGKTIRLRWDFCRSQFLPDMEKCWIPARAGAEIQYSPSYYQEYIDNNNNKLDGVYSVIEL